MSATMHAPPVARQVRLPDQAERMAKATVRKADPKVLIGQAIQRAVSIRGWTLKEFAREMGRDERLCARWFTGEDRPPFDVLLTHEELRGPLVVELARLAECEVRWVIEVGRAK